MQTLERYTEGQREALFSSLKTQFDNGVLMTKAERELYSILREYFKPEAKDRKTVINKLSSDAKKLVDLWKAKESIYNEHGNIHPKHQKQYDSLENAYEKLDENVVKYLYKRNVTSSEFFQSGISIHWEGYEFDEVLDAYSYLNPNK